jgi:hypothetical protein
MLVVRKVYKPSPSHQKFIDILTEKDRPKKVASLMDEYLGDQKEYQKAVDDGFQGTYEEFLRMKSMRENAAYGGRMGYAGAGLVLDIGTAGIKKAIPFVKQKLNEIIPYGGSTKGIGTSTPKADVTPERNFIDSFSKLQNTYFGGNFTKTSEALGENRNKIKGIFDRLRQRDTGTRAGADVGKSPRMTSTVSVTEDAMSYPDATTLMKYKPEVFKNLLKPKDEYLNQESLGHYLKMMFERDPSGVKSKLGKTQYDAFGNRLRNLGVKSKTNPGGEKTYSVNQTIKKMLEGSQDKRVKGDVKQFRDDAREKVERAIDPDLFKFRSSLPGRIANLSKKEGVNIPGVQAVDDVGHPFSVSESTKFKNLFKDSNINKLNTLVYQDKFLNQDLFKVTGYEKNYVSMFKDLEKLRNKPVTKETQKKLLEIKNKMNNNYNYIVDIVSDPKKIKNLINKDEKRIGDSYAKYISGQTDRIQKIDINIPKIGEKFQSKDLFVDMSKVNPNYIMGYVDKINPNAKRLKDLSMSERAIFESNARSQNADIVTDFYKKAKFGKEPIEELRESISYDFAKGGPVNIDFNMRPGYGRGYLVEGAKGLGKKYRGSTLEALLENPKIVGTELGYEGISALMRLLGLYQSGGSVREGIASLNVKK